MIARKEILMGREVEFPLTPELEANLTKLLEAVNKLRTLYGKPMYVNSGYRPGHFNTSVGGAKGSTHITCEAADFRDNDGELKKWITPEILEECGLYMEDPDKTLGWCHLDIRPRTNRVFKV
jgi:zinc D-Ala-D-Ala carboxypeptidase